MRGIISLLVLTFIACKKPPVVVGPCDEDLGFATKHEHLANVQFLTETKQVDWFEIYDNLTLRHKNIAPKKCIPTEQNKSIE
ncbi:MAG TPA: hypothetical protein PLY93_14380, partial [Turneriella sp.]|nr:hypothetical protein [Turneriella sp.]